MSNTVSNAVAVGHVFKLEDADASSWSELQARIAEDARQTEMLAAFTHLQAKFAKKPTLKLRQEYVAVLTSHGYKCQWVWTAAKTEIIRSWAVFATEVK